MLEIRTSSLVFYPNAEEKSTGTSPFNDQSLKSHLPVPCSKIGNINNKIIIIIKQL